MWTFTVSIVAIAWVVVLLWIMADVVRRPDLGMAATVAWAIILIVIASLMYVGIVGAIFKLIVK